MKTSVAEQVRDYAEYVDSMVAEWTVEDIVTSPIEQPPTQIVSPRWRSPSARHGLSIALGAAVVTLVVVGLTTWLLAGSGSDSLPVINQDTPPTTLTSTVPETTLPGTTVPPTTPPSSTVPATTVPAGDAAQDWEALGWQKVDGGSEVLGGDTFGAHWDQIISGPNGYLAWGYTWNREDVERLCDENGFSCRGGGSDLFQGAAWTSPDGVTWTKHDAPELLSAYVTSPFLGGTITAGGPGFVGAAAWAEEPVSGPFGLLSSPDGSTWTSTSVERGAVVYDIAVGTSQWVAVGSFGDPRIEATGGAAWRSTDRQTWQRTELYRDADDPTGNSFGTSVTDVVAGGPGFVAVRQNLQTWNSADGVNWTRGEDLLGFTQPDGTYLSAIRLELMALEEGLVVVGEGGVVWTSPDGESWTLVHQEGFGLDANVGFLQTAGVGGLGVVAFGQDVNGSHLFTSPDAINWSKLPAPPYTRTVGPFGEDGLIAGVHSVWPPMTPDLSGVEVWIWKPPS